MTLGPRRVMPVSLLAMDAPDMVRRALEEQLRAVVPGENDARFVRAVPGVDAQGLGPRETAVLARVAETVGYSADYVDAAMDVFLAHRNDVEIFPEVRPALEELGRRYKVVAVTNGNASL